MKNRILILVTVCLALLYSCSGKRTVAAENINTAVPEESDKAEDAAVVEEPVKEKLVLRSLEGSFEPEMVYVAGGSFIMGAESEKDNLPHEVELSSFYMAKYLITVAQWRRFLQEVPLAYDWDWEEAHTIGKFKDTIPTEDCPIQQMSWYYAIVFCNWASMKDGLEPCYSLDRLPEHKNDVIEVTWNKSANGYRLATDAEWEYAARGGQESKGYLYAGSNDIAEVAAFGKSSYPVGQMKPNELGIYDMAGNASEWCWDWYDKVMFEWLPKENPSVDTMEQIRMPPFGTKNKRDYKVVRGSDWWNVPLAVSSRGCYPARHILVIGIRLVRNGNEEKVNNDHISTDIQSGTL